MLLQMQRHPELAQIMAQARQNPALLMSGSEWAQPAAAPTLSPGQMMTADGFVVDGSRFTALDAADADEHTQNGDF